MKMKKKIITFVVSLCMILGIMAVPAHAENEAILEARKGILQVAQVIFVDGTEIGYAQVGTGFLIGRPEGAQTVLTNYHVAHAVTEDQVRAMLGTSIAANARIEFKIRVVVKRDVFINASIVNESRSADFTILKLEQPLYDRAPLKIGDSDNVSTTQDIFALGFPGIVSTIQLDTIYTADDVTVTSGIVSKTNDVVLVDAPIPCITHSARVSEGNSGGPLLNANGAVIGINSFISSDGDGNNDYFYSIQINEVTDVLNALGIEYEKEDAAPTPPVIEDSATTDDSVIEDSSTQPDTPVLPAVNTDALKAAIDAARLVSLDGMTEESVTAFRTALNGAETAFRNAASQEEVDAALRDLQTAQNALVEAPKGLSTLAIVLIAVGAVLLIGLVVLLILLSAKKKKAAEPQAPVRGQVPPMGQNQGGWGQPQMPQQPRPQVPPMGGYQPQQPQRPVQPARPAQPNFFANPADGAGETSVLADGAGETSVLNDGAGETTVLGGASIPAAYLVRKKNSDRVNISKQIFKIGKERRRVDYCISDNTSISRSHADIVYKNGAFFLVDNNATNGTYVNGKQVAAGSETALHNNDVIKLADEEFTFQM